MTNSHSHHSRGYDPQRDTNGVLERHEVAPSLQRTIAAFEGLSAQWRRGMTINAHERLALVHLWESGSMTMSELGERIPLSRAAVTALTDRLERMGYLRRTPHAEDRRTLRIELTDAGLALSQELRACGDRMAEYALRTLMPDEREHFVGLLERVHASL